MADRTLRQLVERQKELLAEAVKTRANRDRRNFIGPSPTASTTQGAPRKPNLSDFSGAITSYEKARDIRKRLREKNPGDWENLRRFAGDLSALSTIRWWVSDTTGSLEDSQGALTAYEALLKQQPDSLELQLAAFGGAIRS